MSGDYVNAITAERARYQSEYLRGGYSTHQQESLMDAHARKCARIIAQAYHNGDYSDMWLALSMCARYGIATPSPTHYQPHYPPHHQHGRVEREVY